MANEDEKGVGRETLDETRSRAAKFLGAIGTNLLIRSAMMGKGYTDAHHTKGWTLLHAASGYTPTTPLESTVDATIRDAITALDNADEDLFRVARATLIHNFPAQASVVLDGIGPSSGADSIVGVKKLVERLRTLQKSTDATDKAAFEELSSRTFDEATLVRLEGLVAAASRAPALAPVDTSAADARESAHLAALRALRTWYEEWSEIARAAVKRRDHLILMGLAKRKSPRKPT